MEAVQFVANPGTPRKDAMPERTLVQELDDGFRLAIALIDHHLNRRATAPERLAGSQEALRQLEELYRRWFDYAASHGGQEPTVLEVRLVSFLCIADAVLSQPLSDDAKLAALQQECRIVAAGFARDDRWLRDEMLQQLLAVAEHPHL